MQSGLNSALNRVLMRRRLVDRIEEAWRAAKPTAAGLPSWRDIQECDFGDDWRDCFALDLMASMPEPYLCFLGDRLRHWIGAAASETAFFPGDAIAAAALQKKPVRHNAYVSLFDGTVCRTRGVFCPLAEEIGGVTHIFGAVNGVSDRLGSVRGED